jgi:hypothetical protein
MIGERMRHFIAYWNSEGKSLNKKDCMIYIKAEELSDAQDQFFALLKKHSIYKHMWRLELEIVECTSSEEFCDNQ